MLVGGETPATQAIGFDKKALGYISDNAKLASAYAAADVVVVPSLEETFSNTAAEAVACGVPVVGFKTGAIPDLAVDGKTGYTYRIGDTDGLAEGVRRVLTGPDLGGNCRAHAETMLSFMTQARRYETLFHELVARNQRGQITRPLRIFNAFEEPSHDQILMAAELMSKKA
jgi:glycosyltransferase involved in cell wall biosynthesis